MVILHGFTESAEKFRETAYYFLNEGYSVLSLDLRGHALSYRKSEAPFVISIDSFMEYAEDLNCFIDNVVLPFNKDKPVYIFSHSLGSTAVLLYLKNNPDKVKKAVLSSPMICGNMGMPVIIANTVAKLLCAVGGKSIPAPGRCKFNPEEKFESSDATSKARFEYYHQKRIADKLLQTSGPSFDWVKASVKARDDILSMDKISTKLLIFKPEQDKQLLSSYLELFAKKHGIEPVFIKGAKHEIFQSDNSALEGYYLKISEFFDE